MHRYTHRTHRVVLEALAIVSYGLNTFQVLDKQACLSLVREYPNTIEQRFEWTMFRVRP